MNKKSVFLALIAFCFLMNSVVRAAICPTCHNYEAKSGVYFCSECGSMVSKTKSDDNNRRAMYALYAARNEMAKSSSASYATSKAPVASSGTAKGFSRIGAMPIPRGRGKGVAIIVGVVLLVTLGIILFYDYPVLGIILIALGLILAIKSSLSSKKEEEDPFWG